VAIDGCESGTPNLLGRDGCTFSDRIAEAAHAATNHGDFVSRVTRLMVTAKNAGLISGSDKGAVVRCAAMSALPRIERRTGPAAALRGSTRRGVETVGVGAPGG
jgi:hypothetical protein